MVQGNIDIFSPFFAPGSPFFDFSSPFFDFKSIHSDGKGTLLISLINSKLNLKSVPFIPQLEQNGTGRL
jgi:hypothetical protein